MDLRHSGLGGAAPTPTPTPTPTSRPVDHARLTAALDELADLVTQEFTIDDVLRRLARVAGEVLDVDGAGVMVVGDDGLLRFAHATSGPVAELERLQEALQDGPCQRSRRSGAVVNLPDLGGPGDWPAFQDRARALGLQAVTSLPLLARDRDLGILDLYRRTGKALSAEETDVARTLAKVAASYVVMASDRDEVRQVHEQLARRAMHDPLTDLPVRWVFVEQLEHALSWLQRRPGQVGVLFLDLDHLKHVNDTFGHGAGDVLLQHCASRVVAALRPTDVVARIGGDEFVVLLEAVAGPAEAAAVAGRVGTALGAPLPLGDGIVRPSASIGVATTADPHLAPSTLISHADAAMYRAKRSGRGRVAVFDAAEQAAEHAAAGTRDQLARELASAVAHAQLELHYQPILDLRTGATRAVEALLRWRHPTRGLLTAAQFIEQAESSRLILDLSGWVVDTACRQLAAWDAALGERAPGSVCVNLSTLELGQPSLDRAVGDALDRWQIPPDRLTLEITETGLMDEPGAAAAVLQRLRDRGCRIAIDDFGTGYSSLSRVVEVPADMIKVDRTFTSQLSSGGPASAVVSAVLHIADRLGRTVVVEGVEDDAAARTLLDLGVSYGQGFHLAVPQSGEDLTRSLSG